MAGSIKIQHGATASTPQAGFSTLWVRSSDGEFYYTKPDGTSASLVGENGATGAAGPTGSVGPTGAQGPIGPTGAASTVPGPQGPTGAQGPIGPTGAAAPGGGSPITIEQTNSLVSTAIGATAAQYNSVVIGATACSSSISSIIIGENASDGNNPLRDGIIVIGKNAISCTGTYGCDVVIGTSARSTGQSATVVIGYNAQSNNLSTSVGYEAVSTNGGVSIGVQSGGGSSATALGNRACASGNGSVSTGHCAVVNAAGHCGIAIGKASFVCAPYAIAMGSEEFSNVVGCIQTVAREACSIAIGKSAQTYPGATGTIVLGVSSVGATGIQNAVVIGNNLTSVVADTTHINALYISTPPPTYSNNANAKAGGLVDGQLYKDNNGHLHIVFT